MVQKFALEGLAVLQNVYVKIKQKLPIFGQSTHSGA